MRKLALLGAHGVVSTVFAAGAVIIGPHATDAQSEHVVLVTYTLIQFFAALLIAEAARPGSKVPMAVAAAVAAAWGAWCSLIAGMAVSGSWL